VYRGQVNPVTLPVHESPAQPWNC